MPGFPFRLPRLYAPALLLVLMAGRAGALTGDVDDNLRLNRDDAAAALAAGGGLWTPFQVTNGDVAGAPGNQPDGRIALADAVRILRVINRLDTFEPPVFSAPARETLTLGADLTRDFTLPRAYWLRGTVTNALGTPIGTGGGGTTTDAAIVFTPADPMAQRKALINGQTGAYVALAAAGDNAVAVETEFTERVSPTGPTYSYGIRVPAVPASVTVTADATADFMRPDPPAPGTLSGSIVAPGWDIPILEFRQADGSWADAVRDGGQAYSLRAGPGTGRFLVEFAYGTGDAADTMLSADLAGSPVTVQSGVTTAADVTLPQLVVMRGSLAGAGTGRRIGAIVKTASGSLFQAAAPADSGEYVLGLPAGAATVVLSTTLAEGPESRTRAAYAARLTVPDGGLLRDLTLPVLPSLYRLTGRVVGPDGKPLAHAFVVITPQGYPGDIAEGWSGFAETATASDGTFTVQLPAASYDVEVTPPTPDGPPPGTARRALRLFLPVTR